MMIGDPEIPIYSITLTNNYWSWKETFGTKLLLRTYISGVQAGYRMIGVYIRDPEIP